MTAVLVAAALAVLQTRPVLARDIAVNSFADSKRASDGVCSLREAIIAANSDTPSGDASGECPAGQGDDTILLPPGVYRLTRTNAGGEDSSNTGDLDVTGNLTIQPEWWPAPALDATAAAAFAPTIIDGYASGGSTDRIFHILGGHTQIRGITLRDGKVRGDGGAVYVGAGASLTLSSATVTQNRATGMGGGIYNAGILTLTNVTLGENAIVDNDVMTASSNAPAGAAPSGGSNLIFPDVLPLSIPDGVAAVDYAGGRAYYKLLPDSPFIDTGDAAFCTPVDQRRVARPQGVACDQGAYELRHPTAVDDAYSTSEDTPLAVPPPGASGVLDNDFPGELSGALSAALVSSVPAETGTLALNIDGSFVYTPAHNYFGVTAFQYQIAYGSGMNTPAATVTITVTAVNDLPVATSDAFTVAEDSTANVLDVLANDSDVEDGKPQVVAATDPAYGSSAVVGGALQYTPDPNFDSSLGVVDTFQYTVRDSVGAETSAVVTMTVTPDGQIEVTNTASNGPGSLVAALQRANTAANPDAITFELPANSVITLFASLVVTNPVGITGTPPGVILRCEPAGSFPALVLQTGAAGSTVQGLTIENCSNGIVLNQVSGVTLTQNTIRNNSGDGIVLLNSPNNTITGNTITGNGGNGISITGSPGVNPVTGAGGNQLAGNTITGNGAAGVQIVNSANNALSNNAITGNTGAPIDLGGDGPTPNDPGDEDFGANFFQNYPDVARAIQITPAAAQRALFVGGLLNTKPGLYQIHLYISTGCGTGDLAALNGGTPYSLEIPAGATEAAFNFTPLVDSSVDYLNWVVRATATDADGNTSELSGCTRVSEGNDIWPGALPVTPSGSGINAFGASEGYLDQLGQSRWYKLKVTPNSRYKIDLTNLPANYDLTVYTDLVVAFNELAGLDPNQLAAEISSDPTNPSQAVVQGAYSSAAVAGSALNGSALNGSALNGSALNGSALNGSALNGSALNGSALNGSALNGSALNGSALNTLGLSADEIAQVYSTAQARALIAVSAFEGTSPESAQVNSWNNTGEFYIRVSGSGGVFDPTTPYLLSVEALEDPGCSAVIASPLHDLFEDANFAGLAPVAGTGVQTVILADYTRMRQKYGNAAVNQLATTLNALAADGDVKGAVVDVGNAAAYPRVAAANQLAGPAAAPTPTDWPFRIGTPPPADLIGPTLPNPNAPQNGITCPYAKNLVARSIKEIVDSYAVNNPLKYVVVVGNDDVIPFFRYPDAALLGPEADYVVPLENDSSSEYALRLNYVLSQDAYGAGLEINLKDNRFPIPKLAVGRLVERPSEIVNLVNAFLTEPGGKVLTPQRALVTGYDFLEDSARRIAQELTDTIGAADPSRVDTDLIDPQELATLLGPNPDAWTAQNLIDKWNTNDYDLLYLAGHFEAAAALAGDYRTTVLSSDLLASPIDLKNALIYSAGCHSGYSVVGEHNLPHTLEPDWAQTFALKGATFIGGTGFQYGDTDYIEYSERLYLYFTRELRSPTPAGARSVGEALVAAKQRYLATTPLVRSIHEKALLVSTLFGLPMRKVYLPGPRSDATPLPAPLAAVQPATAGLKTYDLGVEPGLDLIADRRTAYMTSTTNLASIELATWLEDETFGVVTNPGEPVVPVQVYDVSDPSNSGLALRSVAFAGGCYADRSTVNDSAFQGGQRPFIPLTGAPATELSSAHIRFVSNTFTPSQPWSENYFDALAGGDGVYLNVMPVQYISNPAPAAISPATGYPFAVERVFSQMAYRLYYNQGPVTAAPPAIVSVSSAYSPTTKLATFAVRAVGEPDAGIGDVWITFTPSTGATQAAGNGLLGRADCTGPSWRTLRLTQNTADPGLWEGALNLGAVPVEDFRFIVQAVGADGSSSWNTHLGRYFALVEQARVQTQLVLQGPSVATGAVGTSATFRATLTNAANGAPLAGQIVAVGLAQQTRIGQTNANGVAEIVVPLLGTPGDYDVTAWFVGAATLEPATSNTLPYTIVSQATDLALLADTVNFANPDFQYFAKLVDAAGNSLVEKTVFFTFNGAAGAFVRTAKTGLYGEARLSTFGIPLGNYDVTASFGGTASYQAAVSDPVALRPNFGPVAAGEAYAVDEDTPLNTPAPGVLGNDHDANGDTLTAKAQTTTAKGALVLNEDGSFAYTPAPNYAGPDSFTYQVCDIANACIQALASITVRPVNDPPNAADDSASTASAQPVKLDVVDNDTDIENGLVPGSVVALTTPAGGTLVANGDGTFTFTPAPGARGVFSFDYRVSDADGATDTARVTIRVTDELGQTYLPAIRTR